MGRPRWSEAPGQPTSWILRLIKAGKDACLEHHGLSDILNEGPTKNVNWSMADHRTTIKVITDTLSLPPAPHQNPSVLPQVPWPLSIVAILRLRILRQHRQGWQRSRGSLGRCGPTRLAQHSTNLGRSWFLDRHQQTLVFWRERESVFICAHRTRNIGVEP